MSAEAMTEAKAQVEKHYNEAYRLALQVVKAMVIEHMTKHPDIQTFCMCMGGWTYHLAPGVKRVDEDGEEWDMSGEQVGEVDPRRSDLYREWDHPELEDLLDEWDEYLKLTGAPIRYDRQGDQLVMGTDW